MKRSGTDLMAVAAVVGGGLIAGGVTLALADGPALPSMECVTTVGADADVMVKLGEEGVVMLRPDVRVDEMRHCMADGGHDVVIDLHQLGDHTVHIDRERIKREVEQARREAEQVRREVERVRDRIRRGGGEAQEVQERAREQVQRALERAELAQERAGERAERGQERAERARERATRAAFRAAERHESEAGRTESRSRRAFEMARGHDLEELDEEALREMVLFEDGLRIELPEQTFEFHFEGLDNFEFEGIEDALRIQLDVLEGMELEIDGVDEDLQLEIEQRIEEKMKELRERLERIGDGSGR